MITNELIEPCLSSLLRQQLPRVLTQACRDPFSRSYGCFDRNWWHYNIRDFPSIILQQGAYMLHRARISGLADHIGLEDTRDLERAALRFWICRARRFGAFEEYYPWERGYPPLAFSTLAVAKMLNVESDLLPEALPALYRASSQLCSRFEQQAANQQVAGLAALAWLHRIHPPILSDVDWITQRDRALSLQANEGWFEEYGGPDLGYLSVTIDCLWDIIDACNDERSHNALRRAIAWSHPFISAANGNIGMHNSRNTDYLVPYGFARASVANLPESPLAHEIISAICTGTAEPSHPLSAVDDRYWSHYTGHSVVRAWEMAYTYTLRRATQSTPQSKSFVSTGHQIVCFPDRCRMIISTNKGGNVTFYDADGKVSWSDFGWIVTSGKIAAGMNWLSKAWKVEPNEHGVTITGPLARRRNLVATPLGHLLLRAASLLIGPRLISALKRIFIFKRTKQPWHVVRNIHWEERQVTISDTILADDPAATVDPAPRSSNRHVSSADSFHPEDLMKDGSSRSSPSRHDQRIRLLRVLQR